VTFTYNLNKSSLDALLSGAESQATKAAVEAALHFSNLSNASTILTTFVDSAGPHVFNASTIGLSNFTTSGQLLIADIFDPAGDNALAVTDSAGGNYFVTGTFADQVTIDNLGSATDYVFGNGTGEAITLGQGSFVAYAGAGASSIHGGSGAGQYLFADTTGSASAADTLVAGAGAGQVLDASYSKGSNVLWGGSDSVSMVHNMLFGGDGSDVMWGGGLSLMKAGRGDEYLHAGLWSNSADTLYASEGNDTLATWEGNDLIIGYNTDPLLGGRFTEGHNTIWTGSGNDTILAGKYSNISGVAIGDTEHTGTGKTFIWGSDDSGAQDTITAGMNDMYIGLNQGNTTINGGSGRLFAYNGYGADTINLGSGNDTILLTNIGSSSITGGTGNDTIYYWQNSNATIHGGANTTVDLVDVGAYTTSNANGVTTYTFSATGKTLTVDHASVSTISGGSVAFTSYDQFKSNS